MTKSYGHSTASPEYNEKKLVSFNHLLSKLCSYINKYDESFLGYLINKEAITNIESQINNLLQGHPDSSFTFIHKKISYKTTKLNLLEFAQKEVYDAMRQPGSNIKHTLRFFTHFDESEQPLEQKKVLCKGLHCLHKEILRQEEKVNSLKACLPSESPTDPTPNPLPLS